MTEKKVTKKRKSRELPHYKKREEVKKDTLLYITMKKMGEISFKSDAEMDDNFKLVYQTMKRRKKYLTSIYPFESLDKIEESRWALEQLLPAIYDTKSPLYKLLKKIKKNERLTLEETREYYDIIEFYIGKEALEEFPFYNKYKDNLEIMKKMEELQSIFSWEFSLLEDVYNETEDESLICYFLDEYKKILDIHLADIKEKIEYEYHQLLGDTEEIKIELVSEEYQYDVKSIIDRKIEEIQAFIEDDLDLLEYIFLKTKDKNMVKNYIELYIEKLGMKKQRLTEQLVYEHKILRETEEKEETDEPLEKVYKYNEVDEKLKKNIDIVNTQTIWIDCMHKSLYEIREEGYMKNLPTDNIVYINLNMMKSSRVRSRE